MLMNFILNFTHKEKKQISFSNSEKILIETKVEGEVYSIFVYSFLITIKYFNFSTSLLTDCIGRALKNYTEINFNHYVLIGIMILKCSVLNILYKIFRNKYLQYDIGYNPKLTDKTPRLLYIFLMIGTTEIL